MTPEIPPPPLPSADAIDATLAWRVDACAVSPSMVRGLIDNRKHQFFVCGEASVSGALVTDRTVLETPR